MLLAELIKLQDGKEQGIFLWSESCIVAQSHLKRLSLVVQYPHFVSSVSISTHPQAMEKAHAGPAATLRGTLMSLWAWAKGEIYPDLRTSPEYGMPHLASTKSSAMQHFL